MNRLFTLLFLFCISLSSCNTSVNTKEKSLKTIVKANKVEVLYFHYSRRCVTCTNIENVAKQVAADLGDKVSFSDFNLDEELGEKKAELVNVYGQTLLIIAGESTINITNEAFLHGKSNPEKLTEIIKKKIEPFL